jgi:transposase-like protein
MSRSTVSTFQLFEKWPTEESARIYIEKRLWPNGPVCPRCKATERITARKSGFYRCNPCKWDFTVRTGTIFGRSHVPLHKWLYAMYLLVTSRKGISSLQMSKEIGVKQHTAWFILQRLREACGAEVKMLQGIVEVDETFITGKEQNRHMYDRIHDPRERSEKAIVVGMRERGGNTVATVVQSTGGLALRAKIHKHVVSGTRVMTDDYGSYIALSREGFKHESVKHVTGEYVRGDVHTNSIESVWAILKRGVHGTFHHVSKKHLNRYVSEFTFRLNDGKVQRHTFDRLDSLIANVVGKRLTYQNLIEEKR